MGSIDDFPVDRDDDCRSLHTNSTLEHLFPPKLPSLGMMKVDGKSPDVLYVVNYRNHKDRLLDRKSFHVFNFQFCNPFTD